MKVKTNKPVQQFINICCLCIASMKSLFIEILEF